MMDKIYSSLILTVMEKLWLKQQQGQKKLVGKTRLRKRMKPKIPTSQWRKEMTLPKNRVKIQTLEERRLVG
jgi:hypothetical protein